MLPGVSMSALVQRQLTVNLWGHLSGGFGLGEGARCTMRSLQAAGVRVQVHDLPLATHVNDQPTRPAAEILPAAVDLIHTNPNVLRQTDGLAERLQLKAPLRIGFWAWELEDFPSGWESGFIGLDQLWCPSSFSATSLGLRSPIPVTPLPHLIDWARADAIHRQRQVLKRQRSTADFVCVYLFDLWSTVGRKNPYGVIDAFQQAFPSRQAADHRFPDARLVLKVGSGSQFPQELASLRQRISHDSRIQLIDAHLTREQLDQLLINSDVMIHLHRAEGFGLAMAEAMAAGIAVVATGYSGNLDFMPPGSSALVDADLVPILCSEGDYRCGSFWGEPNIDQAATYLRALSTDPDVLFRLSQSGRQAVQRLLAPERLGKIVKQRLGCLLAQAGRAELIGSLPLENPFRVLEGQIDERSRLR
ncbi:hypothetical protein IFHNHDMJ_00906 [Synechococcus sp. CBW1107]|nr:hypothetical protein IFHNHDMJ_00906 [Synechococcus sp. CBW1107]